MKNTIIRNLLICALLFMQLDFYNPFKPEGYVMDVYGVWGTHNDDDENKFSKTKEQKPEILKTVVYKAPELTKAEKLEIKSHYLDKWLKQTEAQQKSLIK